MYIVPADGDSHQYPQFGGNFAVDCEDLSKFQTARFVSEYGFISMESWASMASMVLPTDLTADGNSSQMFFRYATTHLSCLACSSLLDVFSSLLRDV